VTPNAPRILVLLAAAALLHGSAAEAGPLVQLTWSQNIQGIAIEVTGTDTDSDGVTDIGNGTCVDTLPNHLQTSIVCPNGLVGASGSQAGLSYNVSLTMPLFTLNTFATGGALNVNTMATLMGSASINGGASYATANQAIGGMFTVRVAAHAAKGVNASMQLTGKTTLVKLPLSIGAAGQQTGYFTVSANTHHITIDFYGWTPHTRIFTGLTSKYAPLPTPTVVAMGSIQQWGQVVTLVAPSKISIDGPLSQRRTASFTALRLTFIPEPSALLLGAVAAGFTLVAGRRRRRA
jgi:hypothetical protein